MGATLPGFDTGQTPRLAACPVAYCLLWCIANMPASLTQITLRYAVTYAGYYLQLGDVTVLHCRFPHRAARPLTKIAYL